MEDHYKRMIEDEELTEKQRKLIRNYKKRYVKTEGPIRKAGFWSLATFSWLNPMFSLASSTIFKQEHHYKLRDVDMGKNCVNKLKKNWFKRYPKGVQPAGSKTSAKGLFIAIVKTYPWYFVAYITLSILFSIVEFINAKIMNIALKTLQHQKPTDTFLQKLQGAGKLIFILIFTDIGLSILKSQNDFIITLLGQRIRHGVNGLVFQKMLQKSMNRDSTFSLGEITNITQVDTDKIAKMANYTNRMIVTPIEIIVGVIWIYFLVGLEPLLAGLFVMCVFLYFNKRLSMAYRKQRTGYMNAKDSRGKLVTEVFTNIRFVKMCGLENYFLDRISEYKKQELYWTKKQLKRRVNAITINNAAPLAFLCAMFGTYIYCYGNLDIPTIFTVMQIYGIFRRNFRSIPYMLIWAMDMSISGQRITFFLLSEKIEAPYIEKASNYEDTFGDTAIDIKDGNFYWEDRGMKMLYQEEKDRIAAKGKIKKKKRKSKRIKGKKTREDDDDDESRALSAVRSRVSTISLMGNMRSELRGADSESNNATLCLSKRDFNDDDEFERFTRMTELNKELTDTLINADNYSDFGMLYSGINLNLKNINLNIKKGQCVAVIGKVGCGKSSLLSCLAGEMYHKLGSEVKISGEIAYVSQKAWIMSKSIKENILFQKEYNEKRYKDAIKYSCMTDDLKIFNKAGNTQLGDKGVNLSGGQKIRLSIARAMYSNRDIYLFDDPISALDIHVGKYVMEEGIIKYLKGRTRIVATHAIAYLKFFDYVYILDEGEIVGEGTYEDVIQTEAYQSIKQAVIEEEERQKKETEENKAKEKERQEQDEIVDNEGNNFSFKEENSLKLGTLSNGRRSILSTKRRASNLNKTVQGQLHTSKSRRKSLYKSFAEEVKSVTVDLDNKQDKRVVEDIIQKEDRAKGNMSMRVVNQWLSLSGGFPHYFFLMVVYVVWCFTQAGAPWFLQWWATNFKDFQGTKADELQSFLAVYMSINLIQLICDYIRCDLSYMGNVSLAKEVNFMMSFKLIHASISKYFDRVPLGRILNRFLKDVEVVDITLGRSTVFIFFSFFSCVTTFTVSAFSSSPILFFFVIGYLIISFKVQRYYMKLLREVQRLMSISSSPVIQIFKECLEGVSTIRYFNKEEALLENYVKAIDVYQKNSIALIGCRKWFQFRVAVMSLMVVIPCILLSLFSQTSVGIFALMLNFLLELTNNINLLLDYVSNHENMLVSLERCTYFMNVRPEEGYKGLDILEKVMRRGKKVRVDRKKFNWPSSGDLVIRDLCIKYRKDLPYVVKNLSLDIKSGTKVGIVGRTGAGKTTLISSIYRTFDQYLGQIMFDGKEIREIDLKLLRNSMTIIPQDPYLFEDTLRNNLDPMRQFEDEKIVEIIQDVGLWPKFEKLDGIKTFIEKGGNNLSQGEKQLVCLARALLFENRLVLMDEATSNIDTQTEVMIQGLVKEKFKNSTILMIAHRLNTILHCDKVLVLEKGEVLEYDDLEKLRGNTNTHFGRMLLQSDKINESLK